MKRVVVQTLNNKRVLSDKCYVAERFFERLIGLMGLSGREKLQRGEAMFFPRCNNIHMWFMWTSIDVIFLRRESGKNQVWRVTSIRERIMPWRPLPVMDVQASETLELPAGAAHKFQLKVGDEVCIN